MTNSKSILKDYIIVVDNVMTNHVCDIIIEEYKDCDKCIIKNNISMIDISFNHDIMNENLEKRKRIDRLIVCSIDRILFKLRSKKCFNKCKIKCDSGYTLLKIENKSSFIEREHFNFLKENLLTCFIQLDNMDEECQFSFFGGETQIKLKKGSAIVFPSNFVFEYKINSQTEKKKNYIITWLR
jgi:hypothetical protein